MKALALKYRPRTFDDLVEQGPIKQILEEQVKTRTHQNSYLFTGGAGTGKTTSARIMANEINRGEGNPIEVDAASNNGVEDVREIIKEARYKSLDSEFKIYILDECHMFSIGAWNALLKLLEEPPAKTIFIMCTTDPQKIPATIISRVQRFDFRRISFDGIVNRLKYILDKENADIIFDANGSQDAEKDIEWAKKEGIQIIDYEMEALEYISKLADGGMRDAITLLDKCISYSFKLNVEAVIEALGTVNYDTMFELTINILNKDKSGVLKTIESVYRDGVDLKQFMRQYMWFILDINKYGIIGSFDYLQIPSTYEGKMKSFAPNNYEVLNQLLQKLMELNNLIKWEPSPKPLIEASLLIFTMEE